MFYLNDKFLDSLELYWEKMKNAGFEKSEFQINNGK